jgi:hypothetical protein
VSTATKPRPFRLTAPVTPEGDLHECVATALDHLLLPPARWTTINAGHVKLTGQQAAKLHRVGVKPGWPDIEILHSGQVYGVELKKIGGALSRTRTVRTKRGALRMLEGQTDEFPRLIAAGMKIAVCHTVDEVLAALAAWGLPLRSHCFNQPI